MQGTADYGTHRYSEVIGLQRLIIVIYEDLLKMQMADRRKKMLVCASIYY